MSPAHHPEKDLGETLARQADRFAEQGSPLELDQVISRAGEIRRGRRMRATMVMAAVVLAVAVPVGITTLGTNDVTEPDKPLIAAEPDLSPISLGDYPQGEAPRDGYAFRNTLYGAGDPIPLDTVGELPFVARMTSGFLVGQYRDQNGGLKATYVGNDGQVGDSWPADSGLVRSPERSVAAFVDNNNDVIAVQDGGQSFNLGKLPAGVSYQPRAMTGEDCSTNCTVYVNISTEGSAPNERVWAISPGQNPTRVLDGYLSLSDVSSLGFAAGQISFSNEGSCSEVRNAAGDALWETCENSLFSFSPDGAYILAGPAYLDGPGGGGVTVLDARTGETVLDLPAVQGAFVSDPRWEDATHVLAPVFDRGMWAIQRVTLDGNREYATEKASDDDAFVSPFKLS